MRTIVNDTFLKRNNYLLVIAAWVFTLAFIINNYWSSASRPEVVQNNIQQLLDKKLGKAQQFFNDTALLEKIIHHKINETRLQQLTEQKDFLFLYEKNDSLQPNLIFWNTQIIQPNEEILHNNESPFLYKLSNGWYLACKKNYKSQQNKDYHIVVLIPVKWNFYAENKYLKNNFVGLDKAENFVDIATQPTKHVIKNSNNQPLFYLSTISQNGYYSDSSLALWLKIIGSILVLFFIHTLTNFLVRKKGVVFGFFVLAGILLTIRILSYIFPIPINFSQLELFSSSIYRSNFILKSLGDLLINSILFLWLILFIKYHFHFNYSTINFKKKWHVYATSILIACLIFLITILGGNIIKSLVADSKISFDVLNFFSLNIYSVIGLIILSLLAISYFFLVQILLLPLNVFLKENRMEILMVTALGGLLVLSIIPYSSHFIFYLVLLIWMIGFLFLLSFKVLLFQISELVSSLYVFWLLFFSISFTFLIVKENQSKELEKRKHYAENIAKKTDLAIPSTMNITLSDFSTQQFDDIFKGFKNPTQNKILKDSIINSLFTGYINKYDTKIFTYDSLYRPLYNEDSVSYNSINTLIQTNGKPTGLPNIFYYDVSFDRFDYIGKKEVQDTGGNVLGYLFLISKPRDMESGPINPEFFSKREDNTIESSNIYSYAVYQNNLLTVSHNDYSFASTIDANLFSPIEKFISLQRNGYNELWYKANKNKVIVIVKSDRVFIESTTLFAYLFCSFLLCSLFFNVINHILSSPLQIRQYFTFENFTIRKQIHSVILLVTVFSFLIIGITTILFFINRYQRATQDDLSRTIRIMKNELYENIDSVTLAEFNLSNDNSFNNVLVNKMKRISDIHLADINLYNLKGDLKISSVPFPYQKGILSKKMDPIAFYHLNEMKKIQFFQEQQIGRLKYLSNYVPVKNAEGKTFAYLNIPFFDSQNNLEDQISNFLVTIINLNAFIFIIAGIIALFITNRITRSFTLISNKMRKINLQTTNEEIVWERNDEIGELVDEYNKMVRQLEISAKNFAKSERADAWSEMARQVAHEIKNPLTPMKLNLQYLQMAITENDKDLKTITSHVAEIILRQIDHLSQIASDFAQFANIDNIKLQKFNVNQVLEDVISLYATNEKVHINTHLDRAKITVEADYTQTNRLFTNLLQNAVQAVPENRKVFIEIKSQLIGNKVLISIKDNGNGIPASMIDKIFTPNFTTKTSGTGLGLAMCKSIVEKVNGKIWFDTEENMGTTFFVELPIIA